MSYIKIGNLEYPVLSAWGLTKQQVLDEIKSAHLSLLLPQEVTDVVLLSFGYFNIGDAPNIKCSEDEEIIELEPSYNESVKTWLANYTIRKKPGIPQKKFSSWDDVREYRNTLLANTDWIMLPDSPVTPATRERVTGYRGLLRNITELYDKPEIVQFPPFPVINKEGVKPFSRYTYSLSGFVEELTDRSEYFKSLYSNASEEVKLYLFLLENKEDSI
jgi:hypothetical protein